MPSAIFPPSLQTLARGCRWEPLTGSRAVDDSLTFGVSGDQKCEHSISLEVRFSVIEQSDPPLVQWSDQILRKAQTDHPN